jgi:mxaL protein
MSPWRRFAKGWQPAEPAHRLAATLLAVAVWLPPITLQRSTYQYLVTFDVTQSMEVDDQTLAGAATSRLAFARAAAREALAPHALRIEGRLGDLRGLPCDALGAAHRGVRELRRLDGIAGPHRRQDALGQREQHRQGRTWAMRSARAIGKETRVVFFTDGQESPPLRNKDVTPPMGDITPGDVGGWLIGVGGDLPARIPRFDGDGNPVGIWAAADVVQRFGPGTPGTAHEHLSELREPHLQALGKLLGLGYRRLATTDVAAEAMLDPALAQPRPIGTDLRWVPALLGLGLLALRFIPDVAFVRTWRRAQRQDSGSA